MYLTRGQLRYLFLWWDSCYVACFRVVFLLAWGILFIFFLSFLRVWWSLLLIFPSIFKIPVLRAFRFFLDLVVLFLASFVVIRFSLLAWYIFLYQVLFLYPDNISSLPVIRSLIFFNFFCKQLDVIHVHVGVDFSCDLWWIYSPVHF